jgi:hypothetical protein
MSELQGWLIIMWLMIIAFNLLGLSSKVSDLVNKGGE